MSFLVSPSLEMVEPMTETFDTITVAIDEDAGSQP